VEPDLPSTQFRTSSGAVVPGRVANTAWRTWDLVVERCQAFYSEGGDPSVSLAELYWQLVEAIDVAEGEGERGSDEEEDEKEEEEDDEVDEADLLTSCLAGLSLALAEYACDDLAVCSAGLYGSSEELPGGDLELQTGISSLVDTLAAALPLDSVSLENKVTRIEWAGPGGVVVTSGPGSERIRADHCIVTVPLGVLQAEHRTLLEPGLPEPQLAALGSLSPGRLAKIFLEWESPWWEAGRGGLVLAWSRAELHTASLPHRWTRAVSSFSEVRWHPGLLLTWVAGAAAELVDSLEDAELVTGLTALLRTFLGRPDLPAPSRVIRHAWTADPLTRGAYRYHSL